MSRPIETVELTDGQLALAIKLPTAPFDEATFFAQDTSAESRRLLEQLSRHWEKLWPEMLDRLQSAIREWDAPMRLGADAFMGGVSWIDADVYMGDQCDIYLSLIFDEFPHWDFFIKGASIVHFQPIH